MKLLFNKNDKGAEELQELTGSFYANNDFGRIKTDILLESEKILDLVGAPVYQLAETFYHDAPLNVPDQDDLLQHLQLPIALMATFRYYQSNIMSHEDSGRKLKVDKDNEATPWEWMLDRDDEAQLRKAYTTIDRLIRFLDKSGLTEWIESDQRKATRELFINNTQAFHSRYPIDESPRFFYAVLPFIAEVQKKYIAKALGKTAYDNLLSKFQSDTELLETEEILLDLVQTAIPLLTMAIAVKRLSLQVLPEGVVQQFRAAQQGRSASQPALNATIKVFTDELHLEAKKALDEIKQELQKNNPDKVEYPLLPNNSETNKYCRT